MRLGVVEKERDEAISKRDYAADALIHSWAETKAALARVAVLEKEIEELKGSSNHANET